MFPLVAVVRTSRIRSTVLIIVQVVSFAAVNAFIQSRAFAQGDTYIASTDFSTTQGYRNWYYLDSTGAQMYFNGWAWQGAETYLLLWGNGGHPGTYNDAVRQWRAPGNGSIHITGNVSDGNTSCGTGVIVSIKKGAQLLWQRTIDNGDTTGFSYDFTTDVISGDQINFVINNRGDWNCDSTNFDPTIGFSSSGALINLAFNKPATQASEGAWGGVASRAVDGNSDGYWPNSSVTHTYADPQAWWQVDLGDSQSVQRVEVWNRTDCCGDRLMNFNVILLDYNQNIVSSTNVPGQAGTPTTVQIAGTARYVKIQLVGTNYLSLAEVRVWGIPSARSTPHGNVRASIPGIIEGEKFDEGGAEIAYHDTTAGSYGQDYDNPPNYPVPSFRQPTDVDIYKSVGYSNSYLVLMQAGDWMNYSVNVAQDGSYNLEARVAWGGGAVGTFHVEMDGLDETGPIQIPDTNWALTTITRLDVPLASGNHIIRIVADTNGAYGITGDIDYLRFTKATTDRISAASTSDGLSESSNATAPLTIINFDTLPTNTVVSGQYQIATFSSYSGGTVSTAYDCSYLGSCPNGIIATSGSGFNYWPSADLYVNFAMPVNGLTFRILGVQGGGAAATIDVYVNNSYYTSRNFFTGVGFLGQVRPPFVINLSDIPHITRIVVRNPNNLFWIGLGGDTYYPLYYDDFAFTPELTAHITSPRVSGSIDGTTPQNTLLGANVVLQSSVNRSGGTYSWEFSGAPYLISSGPDSTSTSSVTIRPIDADPTNPRTITPPRTITAKLTYTVNGVTVSPSVNITVVVPALTSFYGDEHSDQLNRNLGCSQQEGVSYSLGCWHVGATDGFIWHANVQIPAGTYLSNPAESGIKFIQAASVYRKQLIEGNPICLTTRTPSYDGWYQDGQDPYAMASVHYFSEGNVIQDAHDLDPPGLSVEYPDPSDHPRFPDVSADATYVDDQFETYVVYFVTSPTAQNPARPLLQRIIGFQNSPHPFAALRWRWGGHVIFNYYSNPLTLLYTLQSNTPSGSVYAAGSDTTKSLAPVPSSVAVGQCTDTTITTNPIDGSRFYVAQMYLDFLGRSVDQDGWNFWRSNITPCEFDFECIARKRIDVARAFFYSGEFVGLHPELTGQRGTHVYNVGFVYACYRGFLRREPNACPDYNLNGLNFWVNKLDSTNPETGDDKYNEMLKAFVESTEYRNRFVPHESLCP